MTPICEGCQSGIKMCESRPCWGTPEEIEILMDMGETDFMQDYWEVFDEYDNDGDLVLSKREIEIISPAIEDYSNRRAPEWPEGKCVFLIDGLCYIHAAHGYDKKPKEGRETCCKTKNENLHEIISGLWDTKKGKEIVARWKND